jgi:signal transduction histidine kinase
MIKTLYGKLSAILLAIFLVIGVFYMLLMLFVTRIHVQEAAQSLNYNLAEYLVSEKLFIEEGRINEEALKESFHMLMEINPNIELYLLDTEGNIMAYSAPPEKVKRKRVSTEPIEGFLRGSETLPLVGDDPRNPLGRKVFSAAAVPKGGPAEGYLYIILGGEEFDSVAGLFRKSYILRLSIGGAMAGLVFALLAGIFLFGLLTRRLHRLAGEMEAFERSDFRESAMLPLKQKGDRGDEIEKLEGIFAQMSTRIIQQMDRIRKSDSLRRELVSHISHDLRTPLTTMQGYMETLLLKDAELTPEERRTYVETAIEHGKRLNKLVSGLFELAKLEAQERAVHSEPFNLDELIQDVVQKFRLRAVGQGVGIHTHAGRELPFVHADIALIERVMENLLDNALRYTPKDGSVNVLLEHREDAVSVRVSDTGAGIPPEELPGIFERFRQEAGGGRSDASGHAGLGLAITRRILRLHGSDITVESTVNVGTTFTFALPVHQTGT